MQFGSKKRGFVEKQLGRLVGCIDRGLDAVRAEHKQLREYVKDVAAVAATLEPDQGTCEKRRQTFEELLEKFKQSETPMHAHMAKVMQSFQAGLFVGDGVFEEITDNLDLERWFRIPKSHERRIHGHRHAGIRIVLEGPTLVHVLDAHQSHPEPFTPEELLPYRDAESPSCQAEALHRRKTMRKARSKKDRPALLAELERRYREFTTS